MKKINEIFYSLQGEGRNTGRAAIFIRFSGCNLKCGFCDTDHNGWIGYTDEQILDAIKEYPSNLVIFTGGEPTLQLDEALCNLLHKHGYEIAIETNGTRPVPKGVDFITCSPKFEFVENGAPELRKADELKVVYTGKEYNDMSLYDNFEADYYYLQPCDTGDVEKNKEITAAAVQYCLDNPKWRMSLQTQKIINVK